MNLQIEYIDGTIEVIENVVAYYQNEFYLNVRVPFGESLETRHYDIAKVLWVKEV